MVITNLELALNSSKLITTVYGTVARRALHKVQCN